MTIIKKAIILIFLIFLPNAIYASGFIGFGTGFHYSRSFSNKKYPDDIYLPFLFEYEYGKEYRDLWLLHTSVKYLISMNNSIADDLIITSVGIKYVPKFYYYTGNYYEKSVKKYGCFSLFLLPFTIVRDTLINTMQLFSPQHPFLILSASHITDRFRKNYFGLSIMPGVTSGAVDLKLEYTQNFGFSENRKTDFFFVGLEVTFHFPLQKKFLRKKSVLEI